LTRAIYEGCRGTLPITVKCRIGTDSKRPFHRPSSYWTTTTTAAAGNDDDAWREYEDLCHFIETVSSNQVVSDFAVHARIAVLCKSYSPAENRNVPPLQYDVVRRLVQDFPQFTFTLNGGIHTLAQAQSELEMTPGLNGIMIGRAWAADPWSFAMADQLLYDGVQHSDDDDDDDDDDAPQKNRLQILEEYGHYADAEEERGEPQNIRRFIVKAISPLFAGEVNAKRYRIALDEIVRLPKQQQQQLQLADGRPPKLSTLIMNAALEHLSEEALLRTPEESYEQQQQQRQMEEQKRRTNKTWLSSSSNSNERSESVKEWDALRKQEQGGGTPTTLPPSLLEPPEIVNHIHHE
jgi:tRNA-dihydrouridine synthase